MRPADRRCLDLLALVGVLVMRHIVGTGEPRYSPSERPMISFWISVVPP